MVDNAVYKSILLRFSFKKKKKEEKTAPATTSTFPHYRLTFFPSFWSVVVVVVIVLAPSVPGSGLYFSFLFIITFFPLFSVYVVIMRILYSLSENLSIIRQKKPESVFLFSLAYMLDTYIHCFFRVCVCLSTDRNLCANEGKRKNEKQWLHRMMFVNKMLCHFSSSGADVEKEFFYFFTLRLWRRTLWQKCVSVVAAYDNCHSGARIYNNIICGDGIHRSWFIKRIGNCVSVRGSRMCRIFSRSTLYSEINFVWTNAVAGIFFSTSSSSSYLVVSECHFDLFCVMCSFAKCTTSCMKHERDMTKEKKKLKKLLKMKREKNVAEAKHGGNNSAFCRNTIKNHMPGQMVLANDVHRKVPSSTCLRRQCSHDVTRLLS